MSNVVDLKRFHENKRLKKLLVEQEDMLKSYLIAAKTLEKWASKYPVAFETLLQIQKSCVLIQNSITSIKEKL